MAQDSPDTVSPDIGVSYSSNPECLRGTRAACRGDAARTAGVGVPYYRCYYLDSADRVAATDVIECHTDVQAQTRADILLATGGYPGIEVWDRNRMVYRVRRTDKPS